MIQLICGRVDLDRRVLAGKMGKCLRSIREGHRTQAANLPADGGHHDRRDMLPDLRELFLTGAKASVP